MDRGEKGLPDGGVDGDSVVAAMAVSNGGEKETCERGYCSSLSLCYALLLLFDSFVPSVNNVLPSLQQLRGGAGGGGLGSGLDGGRPFFFFFSVFFFCSILLCFCFILLLLTVLLSTGRPVTAGSDDDGATVVLPCSGG